MPLPPTIASTFRAFAHWMLKAVLSMPLAAVRIRPRCSGLTGALLAFLLIGAACTPAQLAATSTPTSTAIESTATPPVPPTLMPTATSTVAALQPATLTPQPAAAWFDLPYASASSSQKLDLYTPAGAGPFPLVVYIHGGGWIIGDKAEPRANGIVGFLIGGGYAVASLNYRLTDEVAFPAQVHDIKTAIRWLRANAAQYRLVVEKVGVWGDSAGGNLAAMIGASCGVESLEGGELGYGEQSSCVQAVVDWYGPMDFLSIDGQFAGTACPQNHSQGNSIESDYVGGPVLKLPDVVQRANPISYVSGDEPPYLIQHGTDDCVMPPAQSQLLHDALAASLGADRVTLHLLEGARHGGPAFLSPDNLNLIVEFLDTHLR